jgi:hypothetical protein
MAFKLRRSANALPYPLHIRVSDGCVAFGAAHVIPFAREHVMTQTMVATVHPLDSPTAEEFRQEASIRGATAVWTSVVGSRRWKSLNRASRSSPPSMQAAPPPFAARS